MNGGIQGFCVACGDEKIINFSLALTWENDRCRINPVCDECRTALIQQIKRENEGVEEEDQRVIRFFNIHSSISEARKRNDAVKKQQEVIRQFSRRKDPLYQSLGRIARIHPRSPVEGTA